MKASREVKVSTNPGRAIHPFIVPMLLIICYLVAVFIKAGTFTGWLLTLFFLSVYNELRKFPSLKGYSFSTIILAAVSLAFYYPQHFIAAGQFRLSGLIIPLLQLIMFGMGCELNPADLAAVMKRPKAIITGVVCHYSIMPLVGYLLATVFGFRADIAAGIILVGCCPSGLASNVMAYLARANLALSVAVTTVSTLLAPLFTPLLMHFLAGRLVTIRLSDLIWDTTKVVLLPVIAGLLFHSLAKGRVRWIERILPLLSMAGITLIIVLITAAGKEHLVQVGWLLLLAVILHNVTGYALGYGFSRLLRFNEQDSRTISLEVGMQNSGLASGIALLMGGMATIGLAPAVFGPVMNVSGSALANWWHNRSPGNGKNTAMRSAKKIRPV